MLREDFNNQIQKLESAFSGIIPFDFDNAKETWFSELSNFRSAALGAAVKSLIDNPPKHHKEVSFPVLSEVKAACRDATDPTKGGVTYLMAFNFCYAEYCVDHPRIVGRKKDRNGNELPPARLYEARCGCPKCKPEFWCKSEGCQHYVHARGKRDKPQPSTEYCFRHSEN